VLVRLSDVQPESIRWLWPGRIAMGKLTLLCGDPGLGKSFVTLDLAARVSSGLPWPDLPLLPNDKGGVVLLNAEDDLADTIRPRLDAAEADVSRIASIQAVRRIIPTGQTQETDFDLTEDLIALEAAITQTPDCRLVVIDPLTAYLGKTDSHKNAEVRAVLARLFELASRHRVALLAVTHLNKASTLPAIYRAMGSLAFVAAARAVWAAVRDNDDETGRRRLFVPIKNNLGTDETGLAYSLEPAGSTARVIWEPDPVDMRADEAMNGGARPWCARTRASSSSTRSPPTTGTCSRPNSPKQPRRRISARALSGGPRKRSWISTRRKARAASGDANSKMRSKMRRTQIEQLSATLRNMRKLPEGSISKVRKVVQSCACCARAQVGHLGRNHGHGSSRAAARW